MRLKFSSGWTRIFLFVLFVSLIITTRHAQLINAQNKNENDENFEIQNKNFTPENSADFTIPDQLKYDPREIEKVAEFASRETGVRKDFLMGLLVVESDLGKNTGECTYQEVEQDAQKSYGLGWLSHRAWKTFEERRNTFKKIADNLGYDYREQKVSCNPANYAGTGGAMGIPQFMPDTWLEYEDRISEITKEENPDPWDMNAGVIAMALKLSDVPGVTNHNIWSERNAAKLYLSGTTSSRYDWYANSAIYWSRNYLSLLT